MDDFLEPVVCIRCSGKGCKNCLLASSPEEVEESNHSLREGLKQSVLLHHKLQGCEVDVRYMRLQTGGRIRVVCGNCMSKRSARIETTGPSESLFHIDEAPVDRFAINNVVYNTAAVRCKTCNRVNLFFDETLRPARRGTVKDKLKMIDTAFRGIVDAAEVTETKADGQ